MAVDPKVWRRQFEAEWPPPDCRVPDDAPKPWFVCGHVSSIKNVLRVDYGAGRERNGMFQLPNGEMRLAFETATLHGRNPGTLFVLELGTRDLPRTVNRLIELAHERGWAIRRLESIRDRQGPV